MQFLTLTGLAIAGLVALGTFVAAAGSNMIYTEVKNNEAEKERKAQAKKDAKAAIPIYENNIKILKETRVDFVNIKADMEKAYEHVTNSRETFESGGYVVDGYALGVKGAEEYCALCTNISCAIGNIERFISDIDADISDYQSKINECNAIINS